MAFAYRARRGGTGSPVDRRLLWVPAVLLAFGLADCSARSERPPDGDDGSQRPADPNAGSPAATRNEPECLSNTGVMELVASGEPEAAIVARVTTADTCFDVSTAALMDLRNAGVSPAVISAITRAARRPGG